MNWLSVLLGFDLIVLLLYGLFIGIKIMREPLE